MKDNKFCIDKICIEEQILKVIGWTELGGSTEYRLLLDGQEINSTCKTNKRPDVKVALNTDTDDYGIIISSDEIKESDWDQYDIIQVQMKSGDEWIRMAEYPVSKLLSVEIKYNIDDIIFDKDNITIRGWMFSIPDKKIDLYVNGNPIHRTPRQDVNLAYKDTISPGNTGFEFTIPRTKVVVIEVRLGKKLINEVSIDISKYKLQKNKASIINKLSLIKRGIGFIRISYVKKIIKLVREKGIKYTCNFIKNKMIGKVNSENYEIDYNEWLSNHLPSKEELREQIQHEFEYNPQISIVVPTYNTPANFLVEMIESVINQTYPNWQLCIADGASANDETINILKQYQKQEARICVKYLDQNYGISGNTNQCLSMATGEYVALFDHDDLLTPNALFEVVKELNNNKEIDLIYTDEDKTDETSTDFFDAHFKPDFAPDMLRSQNYICHFTVFRKLLLKQVGVFRSEYDGSQDHDLILRLTELTNNIKHIPKILYHWRVHKNSTASGIGAKDYTIQAGINAVQSHLDRIGLNGRVHKGNLPGTYRINYEIKQKAKVSILIPNKDYKSDLELCINSIIEKTTYDDYEIIVIENNSETEEIHEYYSEISKLANVKVVYWDGEFNYSAINNFGAKYAEGEYYVLMNNDIEVITPNWIEEMMMYCEREDVGIVGAKLYYPDNTIQHAGVIIGIGGVAGHSHKYFNRDDYGYFSRLLIAQNLSAVTAAYLMIRKSVYNEVDGLDEGFKVAFNDVDLCMKVRQSNKLVVFTPYVEAYHYESKSRGHEDNPDKVSRFNSEKDRFQDKWGCDIEDPYYNKNLTLTKEDFTIKSTL